MKTCSLCLIPKNTSDFQRCAHSKDGLMHHCRKCDAEIFKRRYALKSDQIKKRLADWRAENPEASRQIAKGHKLRARIEALNHYGNGSPKCICCGELDYRFLTIDHINGGAPADRPHFKKYGGLALWLRARGYPPGYQILCWNCNCAKGIYGICPHKSPPLLVPRLRMHQSKYPDGVCTHCGKPGEFYVSRPRTCKKCVLWYKRNRRSKIRNLKSNGLIIEK